MSIFVELVKRKIQEGGEFKKRLLLSESDRRTLYNHFTVKKLRNDYYIFKPKQPC